VHIFDTALYIFVIYYTTKEEWVPHHTLYESTTVLFCDFFLLIVFNMKIIESCEIIEKNK